MLNNNKITGSISFVLLMVFLIGLNDVYAQKAVKVLLDDGTIRHYPTSEVTELTFVDDACDGVRSLTYGGQLYTTVQIGSQCWLEQNLNIGTRINTSGNQTDNSTIEKYCYNDDTSYCNVFGGLYQWAEAVQYKNGATNTTSPNPAFSGNVRGICPPGWHIPTNAEFQTLITNVGGNGNALKGVGVGTGAGAGTNTSGFDALMAGTMTGGVSLYFGTNTVFFCSNEYDATNGYVKQMDYNNSSIGGNYAFKDYGLSVRCLKD